MKNSATLMELVNMIKSSLKKLLEIATVCFCLLNFVGLFANSFDDIYFDDIDLSDLEAFESEHGFDIFRGDLKPSDLLPILTSIGITSPLINETKTPRGRDILYLLPHKLTALERGGVALYYFFNMTDRMRFTVNDLFAQDTINKLVTVLLSQSLPESSAEFSSLIPLFKKLTIQERKTGFLGQFGFVRGLFMFQVHTSLLLAERNFWLSKSDQREVRDIIARATGSDEAALDESEFYRIDIGLGDTRLKTCLNTVNMENFQMDCGVEAILPTSEIFNSVNLRTNVHNIIEEELTINGVKDNAVPVLKNMRDYLIKPRLGNGGHFGFGCFMESKIGIFHERAQLWMRLSYDKLLSAWEDRLVMNRQTVTQETLKEASSWVTSSGATDEARIAKVTNSFLEEYIFPPAYSVLIEPGGVLNFIASVSFDIKRIRCVLGYDFYAQQQERIKDLRGADVKISDIRIENAVSKAVRQHKAFSEVLYNFKAAGCSDMSLGVGGDYTVSSKEIGRDWTLYMKFSASF